MQPKIKGKVRGEVLSNDLLKNPTMTWSIHSFSNLKELEKITALNTQYVLSKSRENEFGINISANNAESSISNK